MSAYISYFTPASWKQAQKNKSELEATNPTDPVLNDEDAQFLERLTSQEGPPPALPERPVPTVIEDDGEVKEADEETSPDAVVEETVVPAGAAEEQEEVKAGEDEGAGQQKVTESVDENATGEAAGDKAEQTVTESDGNNATGEVAEDKAEEDKMTKSWSSYLPSASYLPSTSYLPSMPSLTRKKDVSSSVEEKESSESTTSVPSKKSKSAPFPSQEEAEAATAAGVQKLAEGETSGRQTEDVSNTRTWSSYIPDVQAALSRGTPQEQASASLAAAIKKGKAAEAKEAKEREATEDEKEVSVLLDRLNLSAINNRVFSFSEESQKVYQSFTVVLKDIIAGGPTAYEDLEKLIEENKEQLENMFGNMPPFVQTLVKTLPAKFATSLGPEMFAAMGEKPGNDLNVSEASSSGLKVPEENKKQKRKVPGIRSLVTEQGAVASMLKSILNFLKLRFPAFVTGTNVLMSLAVFILLFVFWYCHKRGKETRLLAEKVAEDASSAEDESDVEISTMPEEKQATSDEVSATQEESKEEDAEVAAKEDEDRLHGTEAPAVSSDAKESP